MTTTLEATAENTVPRSTILSMPEVNVGGMTHYTFKESDEIIANPERGFYSARSSSYPLTASDITSNRVMETSRTISRNSSMATLWKATVWKSK